ncbi:MAG: hypothetical protein AAGG75_13850 [Bacteroidota bacterium]
MIKISEFAKGIEPLQKIGSTKEKTAFNWAHPYSKYWLAAAAALVALIYFLLHTKYIIFDGDDPWSLSQAYNNIQLGLNKNTLFTTGNSIDDTLIFHKTYHYFEGFLLNIIGWTKGNAHLISTAFILLCSILWFKILRHLRFSFDLSLVLAFSMMLFPAFFGAANITRPDAMAFFFATSTFLLFLKDRYILAGIALLVGFEIHVMGVMGAFYILAYVIYNRRAYLRDYSGFFRMAGLFSLGTLIGLGYYMVLHQDVLSMEKFSATLMSRRSMGFEFKNYILTYFVQPLWYQHVWEFLLIVLSLVFYFKNRLYKQDSFVWILLLVLFLSTFVTGRPNRNYILYIYPAFLLLMFYTVEKMKWLRPFSMALAGIFILHYGTIYYQHHDYDFQELISETRESISDKPELPIVGMPDNWYAAMDRELHLIYNSLDNIPELGLQELYLIRNDYIHSESLSLRLESKLMDFGIVKDPLLAKRRRHYYDLIQYFEDHYEYKLVKRIPAYGGDFVEVYHCVAKT